MCIRNNFNQILQHGNTTRINNFLDDCDGTHKLCIKYGSCDYYSMLDDKLKILENLEHKNRKR